MEKKTAAAAAGVKQPPPEKKSLMMIPPDEERCCRNDGGRWRCTKFRMNLGVSNDDDGLDTKYCENHYNFFKERNKKKQQLKNKNQQKKKKKLKKKSSSEFDDGSSSSSGTETWDSNSLEWKKVANHSKEIQQATTINDTSSDIEGGSANVGTKRKEIERREFSGALDFTDFSIDKPSYKMKKKDMEKMMLPPDEQRCCRTDGGASAKDGAKRKKIETTSGELKSSTRVNEPVDELEILDYYKTKCTEFSVKLAKKELELEKMKLELEKKNVECTKLQRKYAEVESRKNAARDEDATEYWRNKCFHLETLVLTLETENLTKRYEELRNSEKTEWEARDLQNEVGVNTHPKLDSEFHKYSGVSTPSGSVHLLSGSDNVEERPTQHGSSSQAHDLEMSNNTFRNLVSNSDGGGDSLGEPEDSTGFVDSQISLSDPMDTPVLKNSDRKEDELDWKSFLGFPFSYTFGLD